jgi:hypothetical protein
MECAGPVSLPVRLRLAILVFLPLAVVATGLAGLVYLLWPKSAAAA